MHTYVSMFDSYYFYTKVRYFDFFQSKRIDKERRVMNWEKLFCRLTAKVGHGRRWKFHIDAFKRHATEG